MLDLARRAHKTPISPAVAYSSCAGHDRAHCTDSCGAPMISGGALRAIAAKTWPVGLYVQFFASESASSGRRAVQMFAARYVIASSIELLLPRRAPVRRTRARARSSANSPSGFASGRARPAAPHTETPTLETDETSLKKSHLPRPSRSLGRLAGDGPFPDRPVSWCAFPPLQPDRCARVRVDLGQAWASVRRGEPRRRQHERLELVPSPPRRLTRYIAADHIFLP